MMSENSTRTNGRFQRRCNWLPAVAAIRNRCRISRCNEDRRSRRRRTLSLARRQLRSPARRPPRTPARTPVQRPSRNRSVRKESVRLAERVNGLNTAGTGIGLDLIEPIEQGEDLARGQPFLRQRVRDVVPQLQLVLKPSVYQLAGTSPRFGNTIIQTTRLKLRITSYRVYEPVRIVVVGSSVHE